MLTTAKQRSRLHRLYRFVANALDLNDLYVDFIYCAKLDDGALMTVEAASGGDDRNRAVVEVALATLDSPAEKLVECLVHELLHTVLWPLVELPGELDDVFSKQQLAVLAALQLKRNEQVTYKLERIVSKHLKLPRALLTDGAPAGNVASEHAKARGARPLRARRGGRTAA